MTKKVILILIVGLVLAGGVWLTVVCDDFTVIDTIPAHGYTLEILRESCIHGNARYYRLIAGNKEGSPFYFSTPQGVGYRSERVGEYAVITPKGHDRSIVLMVEIDTGRTWPRDYVSQDFWAESKSLLARINEAHDGEPFHFWGDTN